MNTKDEIVDAMDGKKQELPPPAIFTQTGTVQQMEACGCFWPEANFDTDKMVALALQPSELFGFAIARVPFTIDVEAHALGCTIDRGTRSTQPSVTGSPYRTGGDLAPVPEDLPSVDEFMKDGWMASVISAAETLSKREDLFVTASMMGPLSVANFLGGFEEMIMGMIMDPDLVEGWVGRLVPYQKAYASRLTEVCDNVMIIEEADSGIIPPEMFRRIVVPNLPPVIKDAGRESYCTIHSCGDTFEIAEELSSLGEDCLSPESSRDRDRYVSKVGGRCRLLGAIDPVKTLLQGSQSDMMEAIRASVAAGFDLIGPECGVPPATGNANLDLLSHYRERLRSHSVGWERIRRNLHQKKGIEYRPL